MWIIAGQSMTKLGDVLTNPKTVLTWMLSALGAPGALLSMLVPVREAGSMLPQLFVSGFVKKFERRKLVFVAGALAQALAIAMMGVAALMLPATAAGWTVLACVALFALARSFCSISSKDVLGRTVPKGFRGRVGGLSNAISGSLSAGAAVVLILFRDHETAGFLAWMVLGASVLWVLGAALYSCINEPAAEPESGGAEEGWLQRLFLVREDPMFRAFIIARGLLLGTALASPLLVVLGQRSGGQITSLVGFILASGMASAASSFLWGRLADRAGEWSMAAGGLVAAVAGVAGIAISWLAPGWADAAWVWPLVFLVFNIGYAGVRLGRKTWVVDAVEGDRRTDYVSASNTLIAVLILATGLLHSPLQAWSPLASLGLYCAMCLAGAGAAVRLRRLGRD
ncbi:MFS transporter [Haloferula sp. A504]|uniref:MFS transporter n=1 Tax=Haloferula sp. A504 TaxID=3373601 RepID=UPI0031C9B8F3|nr:MFS transporter [Verrucomicrobiaceae bacterium E54]